MNADEMVAEARALLDAPDASTAGWWSRGAALLLRQALETRMRIATSAKGADPDVMPLSALILVFGELAEPGLARRAASTWTALSAATHHHAYEMPATAEELRAWLVVVEEVVRGSPA